MEENRYAQLLIEHGVKPTSNRIIIAKALATHDGPMSMRDLEYEILTLDKSSIFRTLSTFKDHRMVHVIEDGEGGVKYELCLSHSDDEDEDEHVHFYCEQCHRTICLHDVPVPQVAVPEGYELHGANYILKGICPSCLGKGTEC